MTSEIAIVLALLAAAIVLFVTEVVRMDVVALLILVTLGLSGLITPDEAFAGFSSPAVMAVLGIFMMSAALERTGVAEAAGRFLQKVGGANENRLMALIMVSVAVLSAVMNNVAATAVLLPAVVGMAGRVGIAPSRLLMPMAYGGIIGGMLTQIGTPPNLIVSSFLAERLHELGADERELQALGLFDFTPIGALVLLVGVVFMLTIGRRLLPTYTQEQRLRQVRLPGELTDLYRLGERLYEVAILEESPLHGLTLSQSRLGERYKLNVLGILRGTRAKPAPDPSERIFAGDILLVTGSRERLDELAEEWAVGVERSRQGDVARLSSPEIGLMEATLTPRSALEGRTLRELNFRERYGVTVLGLWRGGDAIRARLADEPLQIGDALLVQGSWRQFRILQDEHELILLGEVQRPLHIKRAPLAVAILCMALIPVMLGLMPIAMAALAGGLAMILTRCLQIEQAYRSIEWRVIFLMAGMLPLGTAMQATGTAQFLAEAALGPVSDLGTTPLIIALFVVTMLLSVTTSNTAAAVLMAPIALDAGLAAGIDPRIAMLAVAYGASTAFMTPIANQSNVLVMGPGGYRFADYMRVGAPLTLVVTLTVAVALAFL